MPSLILIIGLVIYGITCYCVGKTIERTNILCDGITNKTVFYNKLIDDCCWVGTSNRIK